MKRILFAFAAALLGLSILAGCGALGVPTPETMPQRIAVGVSTVTQLRQAATVLLKADKISVADAENVQAQADNAMAAMTIARTVSLTDPAAGQAKLTAAIAVLTALQAYLATKGATK